MKQIRQIGIVLVLALSGLLAGCTDEASQQLYAGQEQLIENFLAAALKEHPEFKTVSNGGAERLIVKEGNGEELNKNGTVEFYYAGYVLSRQGTTKETLFSTNHEALAQEYGWKTDHEDAFRPIRLNLKKDKPLQGLRDGMCGAKAGEECFILFTTRYAFGEMKLPGVPINSGMIYHIWIEKVEN